MIRVHMMGTDPYAVREVTIDATNWNVDEDGNLLATRGAHLVAQFKHGSWSWVERASA